MDAKSIQQSLIRKSNKYIHQGANGKWAQPQFPDPPSPKIPKKEKTSIKLNHDINIILLRGATKDIRCRVTELISESIEPEAVEGALHVVLRKEGITLPLNRFRFGVSYDKNNVPKSIYNFDLSRISLEELHHFTLHEKLCESNGNEPQRKGSKSANKDEYETKNKALVEGKKTLKEVLCEEDYSLLKSSRKYWTKWRYNVGYKDQKLSDDEVLAELHKDIETIKTSPSRKPTTSPPTPTSTSNSSLDKVINMFTLRMMSDMMEKDRINHNQDQHNQDQHQHQQHQPISAVVPQMPMPAVPSPTCGWAAPPKCYVATHSASESVKEQRYSPYNYFNYLPRL